MPASAFKLPRVAARVFNTPLCIRQEKLNAILHAIGDDLGAQVPAEAARSYEARNRAEITTTQDGVAVIQVVGTLVHRAHGLDAYSGLTSYQALSKELKVALDDPRVKAILLDIDSGGGEVHGLFDFADAVAAAAKLKPLYASVNESAYSAAYAIAAAATKVFVPRAGGVGSVGVVMLHTDRSEKNAKDGLSYTYIHAGKKKVAGNPNAPLDDETRETFQGEVDKIHTMFVEHVAAARGISAERVRATEAGVYFGEEALGMGLADQVGTFDEALAEITAAAQAQAEEEAMSKKLTEENTALKAQLAEANATIKTLKAEADTRRKAEIDAYVEGVAKATAESQAPPTKADLEEIRELFAAGQDDLARKIGAAHMKAADLASAGSFKRNPPAGSDDDDRLAAKKAAIQTEKKLLEAAGRKVELNDEGTKILSCTPTR